MREFRVNLAVAVRRRGLAAEEARLQVEELARQVGPFRIDDVGDGGVSHPRRLRGARLDVERLELDPDAEIEGDAADRIAEILEGAFRIAARIADDDRAAAAPDHLVEAEILEMTTVGEIDELAVVVGEAQRLVDEGFCRELRSAQGEARRAGGAGIAEPTAEADVEQGQEQAERRRGVIAHVRARRGAGERHRGAKRHALRALAAARIIPRRPVAADALRVRPVDPGQVAAADGPRRRRERQGAALLEGEVFALQDVERDVRDEKLRRQLAGLGRLLRPGDPEGRCCRARRIR